MFSTLKVNCVKCDHKNIVEFDALKKLKLFVCKKCDTIFNLFDVYNSLYDTIPLCKKMVDVAVEHTYTNYSIEGDQSEEEKNVTQTLEKNDFPELLRQILPDMILYGNSFVQIIPKSGNLTLKRLEPKELKFEIDWVQEPPRRSYQRKIVKIDSLVELSTEYDVNDCLHFKEGLTLHEPVGTSILGLWFADWYFLRDSSKMVPLLAMEGKKYSQLQWFRNFKESNVIGAAGIPYRLIFPWMQIQSRFLAIEKQRFQHDIELRRDRISRLIERQLFPRILGRSYDYDDFPRMHAE